MRSSTLRSIAATVGLASQVMAQTAGTGLPELVANATMISATGRYIVQFSAAGLTKFRKRDGSQDTTSFFSDLESSGKPAVAALNYTSEVFSGVSFDLTNITATSLAEIQALPEVESVWEAAVLSIPDNLEVAVGGTVEALKAWSPHRNTGVEKLHEQGTKGKGAIVAVVDSGVDYNHPALGGGIGAGFKIESGYDFVGDNYELGGPYVPDEDPMDCLGHGTHVSGIVASSDPSLNGVAPEATIRSYKIFGCSGSVYEDVIIEAFIRAFEEGADIITASLGSDRGFPNSPLALAASNIVQKGVFVSIAAGNSGDYGPYYTSSGANGEFVTSVGSVHSDQFVGFNVTAIAGDGSVREITYLSSDKSPILPDQPLDAFFDPNFETFNICRDWFNGAPDNTVVVLSRGNCYWQIHDSYLFGTADYAFYWNWPNASWEYPERVYYNPEMQPKGIGLISYEDGQWVVEKSKSGKMVFDFGTQISPIGITPPDGYLGAGVMDTFSSWGPTLDNKMKPEISAPGGEILSTYPLASGKWAVLSGTSMATPYIAGVAALYFASRGGRTTLGPSAGIDLRQKIISSGQALNLYLGGETSLEQKAPVAQQGAGLVNAIKVVEYETSVFPAVLNLNDTARFKKNHYININNAAARGTAEVFYTIYHEPGSTFLTKPAADPWVSFFPPNVLSAQEPGQANVTFSKTRIGVRPQTTNSFKVEFTEPQGLNPATLPVYGGKIIIVGDNGEVLSVTYMGVVGDVRTSNMWELERGVPVFLNGYNTGLMTDGLSYTFEKLYDNVPIMYFNMLWATDEFSFDFVAKNWAVRDFQYPLVAGQKGYYGSARAAPNLLDDSVANFPIKFYPRVSGAVSVYISGEFADGRTIPDGEYRILARALRVGQRAERNQSWQFRLSPWFTVKNPKNANATATP